MTRYFTASRDLLRRARMRDAGLLARPSVWSAGDEAELPIFAERACGAHLYDVDGNEFLDLISSFGCVVLGHADPAVDEAVIEQIRQGVSPTLSSAKEVQLAELLSDVVPGAELSTFLRTGSDATSAAIRLARAFTGRRRVLRWGYHGWHDWCAPRPAGVPWEISQYTLDLGFNDLARAGELFDEYGDDVACVMMMAGEVEPPEPGFLHAVKAMAHANGALFVLDEVRTGFRLALGGAQAFFDIRADLVALSKAMGNGYAISAVCGRADVMRGMKDVSVSSAFFRSADGLAAALATIDILRRGEVIPRLHTLGRRLMTGLDAAASAQGVAARAVGFAPMPFIEFAYGSPELDLAARRHFCRAMIQRGVLVHPSHHWLINAAVTESDIDAAVEIAGDAFADTDQLLKK